jgi:hypothetical protein
VTPEKHSTAEHIGRVSAELVGDLFGVSRVTFSRWCNEGIIERQAPANGYDLRVVCRAVVAHYQRIAAGRGGEESCQHQLTAQRVRLARAKAEREERLNAIEAGEVARFDLIVKYLQGLFLITRDRLLSLAGETADACAGCECVEIYEIIDAKVREALEWIADPECAAKQAAAAGAKLVGIQDQRN